ncbi:MAG TPA: hypothetical protein VFO94_13135 [Gammaproteobacteria bacterium]|nr:hypothetical protein [Gammaproteobacteria bacterium]
MLADDRLAGVLGIEIALVLEQPIALGAAMERHLDRPRPREHLRVLERGLVAERVGRGACEALHHPQRVAMEIAGAVEPGVGVEAHRLNDQRVAVPVAARVAHPRLVALVARRSGERNPAERVHVLRKDHELVGRLKDLQRIVEIHRARHAGEIALAERIGGGALGEVLLALRAGRGLVRDLAVGRVHHHAEPGPHAEGAGVVLEVVACGVGGLPDTLKIGFAAGEPRRLVARRALRPQRAGGHGQQRRCRRDREPLCERPPHVFLASRRRSLQKQRQRRNSHETSVSTAEIRMQVVIGR